MSDPEKTENDAMRAYTEVQGMPVEKVLERANKALADKEWMTAHILFAQASKQAIIISAHCIKQAMEHLKGDTDGKGEED